MVRGLPHRVGTPWVDLLYLTLDSLDLAIQPNKPFVLIRNSDPTSPLRAKRGVGVGEGPVGYSLQTQRECGRGTTRCFIQADREGCMGGLGGTYLAQTMLVPGMIFSPSALSRYFSDPLISSAILDRHM